MHTHTQKKTPKNLMLGKKYKQNKNDKRQTGKIFATFITNKRLYIFYPPSTKFLEKKLTLNFKK